MGGGGKKGGKAIAWSQIFSWTSQTATSMWVALGPVWNTITSLWNSVKPLYDSVNRIYQTLKSTIGDLYTHFIKPAWDMVHAVWSKLNDTIDWIDNLYNKTIGRIEEVYDKLFGRIEDLWKHVEDTRDKLLRVISVFNKDLARRFYDTTEKLEASTIGRIRDLRDDLLHMIDSTYEDLRSKINDFYWAVKDLTDQVHQKVIAVEDFLSVSFEKPQLLKRETVKTTADTYGQEWWDSVMTHIAPRTKKAEVEVMFRGDISSRTDEVLQELDKGEEGSWADVYHYIDESVQFMDLGTDPQSFEPDTTLMSREALQEFIKSPRPPDNPETIAEPEEKK